MKYFWQTLYRFRKLRLPFQVLIVFVLTVFISTTVYAGIDIIINGDQQAIASTLNNGLVGRWDFTGNANDTSGYGNNGTTSNASLVTDRLSSANSAYSFTGNAGGNSYIDLPNPTPNFIPSDNAPFSISSWIYPTTLSTSFCREIMGNETYNTTGFRYCINSSGQPAFWAAQSGGTLSNLSSPTALSINTWYHIVISYDGSTATMYVNNVLKDTATGTIKSNTNSVRLAAGIGGVDYFAGNMDDVRFYNRTLTSGEVTDLYNNNLGGTSGTTHTNTLKLASGQKNLVGQWKLDGNAKDSTPYGHDGTIYGATSTTDRKGQANKAYSFNGTSDYINVSGVPISSFSNGFSWSSWIKTNSYAGSWEWIFSASQTAGAYSWFQCGKKSGSGDIRFETGDFTTNAYLDTSGKNIADNQWHNLTCTWDGSTKYVYIDGVLAAQTAATVNNTSVNYGNLYIGAHPGPSEYWSGQLDDIRVYNRAISQSEVASIYNSYDAVVAVGGVKDNVALLTGLIGKWPFTGNANDATPYGNNGTVNSATLTTDRFGASNTAYSFAGTSGSNIGIPNGTPNFIPSNNAPFSLSLWVYPTDITTATVLTIIGNETYNTSGFRFGIGSSGKIDFYTIQSGGNLDPANFESSTPIALNTWYHIAITYDGTTFKMYLNNVKEAAYPGTIKSNTNNLVLAGGVGGVDYFAGKMDDFRIWNRALTAVEVQALYNGF